SVAAPCWSGPKVIFPVEDCRHASCAYYIRSSPGYEQKAAAVAKQPETKADDAGVARMQFLLHMRQRGIMDAAVLRALDEVPREHFVEGALAERAYADQALPIDCGQTISQPYVVAYMTEQLGVKPNHRVLEVGTGSGYHAA